MIIWWKEYTADRFGSVEKIVKCEHCGAEYAYTVFCTTTAQGTSLFSLDNEGAARRAQDRADHKLQDALDKAVEPYWGPVCERFQSNMIPRARHAILWWMSFRVLFWPLLAVPVLACFAGFLNRTFATIDYIVPWPILWWTFGILWTLLFVAPLVQWAISQFYDPNSDTIEGRFRKGFHPGRRYEKFDEKNEAAAVLLKDLHERAHRLLAQPHPLDDEEKRGLDEHLQRYLQGQDFTAMMLKDLLRVAAQMMRSKALQYQMSGNAQQVFQHQECAEVLEGIYIDVF